MKRSRWIVAAGLLLACASGAQAKIVGLWLMDENKGDAIKDATGQHKDDGKFVGGVKWDAAGKFGSAVKFDGSTSHIEIPDPDHRLNPKAITLMAWIRPETVAGTRSILEQYDWAGALGCHAFRMDGGQLQLWVIWGPAGENALGGAITANAWQHVASTFDGQNITLYVNGKQTVTKAIAKRDLAASNKSLSIGVRGDTKDVHWFSGLIDEVAVYDEALPEKDLLAIATSNSGLGATLAVSPKSKAAMVWGTLKDAR